MSDDDRVVLRSSWLVDALISLPVPLAFWFFFFRHDGPPALLFMAAVWAAVTIQAHHLTRVVMSADGIELRSLGRTLVPWSYVRGVVFVGSSPSPRAAALVLPDRSVKPLSAPRSLFGIWSHDVQDASELIEQHWARYRADVSSASPPTA